jgi:F-type H+-transporting ATPase subunit epsilon
MMAGLLLEVVTPERVVVSEQVDIVTAPGSLGEFGVLEGHVSFLTGIVPGPLKYTTGGKAHYLAVTSGFCEVSANKVCVLVDAAEKAEEIDVDRAMRAMERAKERLARARGEPDIDTIRAEMALRRALARIKVAELAKK